jgi:hypothetical protein
MAVKQVIEIDVDSADAVNGIGKLTNQFDDLGKEASKSIKNIEKSTKDTEKSTKSLSDGFKGVGLAIKAMGIGLIIGALSTLKDVFMGNQKVADTFAAVMGTVANVFGQVSNIVVSVIEKVGGASNGFEGLKKTLGGLLTLGLTPLKAAFYGVKLVIDEVRLAWEESVFGDGDLTKIKNLTKSIEETKTSLKKVGDDALKAGTQVVDNIGKAITEVGAVVEGTVDGVSKISIASAYEQSKANVQLQNTAKLAEANQARLVEQYDRQAEKLRQVRDNDLTSIAERIKANDELKNVLDNQQRAMLGQADAQIAAAKATLQQNNNIENRVALTNALANREGVLAQIEGFRSEQDANRNALIKESVDLTKAKQEAETNLSIEQRKFNEELETDELKRLQNQRDNLEQEKIIELERLQFNVDTYKDGTQLKLDAQIEYNIKKQELDNALILNEFEQNKIRTENEKKESETRQEIAKKEAEAKLALLNVVSGGLSLAAQELGESTAAGKIAAVAAASISTYTAIAGQLAAFSGVPVPGYAIAQAILTGATGLLQVKKILSVKTPKGGGGGSLPNIDAGAKAPTPQFNVIGNSGVNQIASTLGAQQPVQAYVVANNVTTAQSLDRNIINNASL